LIGRIILAIQETILIIVVAQEQGTVWKGPPRAKYGGRRDM
jgi:hypothetical protein